MGLLVNGFQRNDVDSAAPDMAFFLKMSFKSAFPK